MLACLRLCVTSQLSRATLNGFNTCTGSVHSTHNNYDVEKIKKFTPFLQKSARDWRRQYVGVFVSFFWHFKLGKLVCGLLWPVFCKIRKTAPGKKWTFMIKYVVYSGWERQNNMILLSSDGKSLKEVRKFRTFAEQCLLTARMYAKNQYLQWGKVDEVCEGIAVVASLHSIIL